MRIAHLGDIHIQDARRDEYAAVFGRLYDSLRENCPDIIVLAGDIFDNKMRASAHNIEDVISFLKELQTIAEVVMIPGNHDTNCSVPGSLDLLTPIVNEMSKSTSRITYWRNSGIYHAHGVMWTVVAPDGVMPDAADATDVTDVTAVASDTHICLFHEEVNGAVLPNNVVLNKFKLKISDFHRFTAAMGGHIHRRQMFSKNAGYCGSLIQQNIGELHVDHGYLLWEIVGNVIQKVSEVNIYNESGFIRIMVEDGVDVTLRPLPKTPRYWEFISGGTIENAAANATILQQYEEMFGAKPRTLRTNKMTAAKINYDTLQNHDDYIREILADDPEIIDEVIKLHNERYVATTQSGGIIRLLEISFSNMYAFGADNYVDFTQLEGCLSGIIAPNHTGKSSFIEVILYALYDDHPRATLKRDIVNKNSDSCYVKLTFELDGKVGTIEKSMLPLQKQSMCRFIYDGEDLTKGKVTDTLAEIESKIGMSSTALTSSFQLQGTETAGFINSTALSRKKLLSTSMALGSFEQIEKSISKELTVLNGELNVLQVTCGKTVAELMAALEALVVEPTEEIEAEVAWAFNECVNIDSDPVLLNLRQRLESIPEESVATAEQLLAQKRATVIPKPVQPVDVPQNKYGIRRSETRPTEAQVTAAFEVLSQPATLQLTQEQKIWMASMLRLGNVYKKMRFVDSCDGCVYNRALFDVAELQKAADMFAEAKKPSNLQERAAAIEVIERANFWRGIDSQNFENESKIFGEKVEKLAADILWIEANLAERKVSQKKRAELLAVYEEKYKKVKACALEKHRLVTEKLAAVQRKNKEVEHEMYKLRTTIESETRREQLYAGVKARHLILKAYKHVLRPNGGIADILLERARTTLQEHINDSLRELGAQFSIEIEPDYELYHVCGRNKLPVGLASGYQKFVLSLSARLAIWRLSSCARPDAFIIDEGFGACDDSYLDLMAAALEALSNAPLGSNNPRLIFIVSHVDVLKTKLERVLEIKIGRYNNTISQEIMPGNALNTALTAGSGVMRSIRITGTAEITKQELVPCEVFVPPPTPDQFYCSTCRQTLLARNRDKHLASKKHIEALGKK